MKFLQFLRQQFCLGLVCALAAAHGDTSFGVTAPKKGKSKSVTEEPVIQVPEVNVDPGLTERVYRESLTASLDSDVRMGREESAPSYYGAQLSLKAFRPTSFVLRNNYFSVPHDKAQETWTGFSVGPTFGIYKGRLGLITSGVGFAYFYHQDIQTADADVGIEVQDAIELQWMPIYGDLRVQSSRLLSFMRLGFASAVSLDWLTQSGELDGMNQSFWIPRYEVGPEVVAFASESGTGFNGLHVSGRYTSAFASNQSIRGWMMDAGAHFAF